jgi:hypothetical protein
VPVNADNKDRRYLVDWYWRKSAYRERHADLYQRVESVLKDADALESAYITLYQEIEGLRQPDTAPITLTEDDSAILTILNGFRGRALTYRDILNQSSQLNSANPRTIRRLSDSTLRKRVPFLLTHDLVARPPGTQKKGIGITDKGCQALHIARGNPPETQRIN